MQPDDLRAISLALKDSINANSAIDATTKGDGKSWRLGMSIIGQECLRKTWYDYRWFTASLVEGRMYRLFSRGHAEEALIVGLLERDGWTVEATDPATGRQWQYSAVHGHYGGACDGIVRSDGRGRAGPLGSRLLLEAKTHNTKSFCNVAAKWLQEGKPQHFGQMSAYGKGFDVKYGLYFAVNKNDDDIHPEFVELDRDLADRMELRAESLILARTPPSRVSNKATDFRCQMCNHRAVCHSGAAPQVHCRSCQHAYPVDNAEWQCQVYAAIIPRHIAKVGCPRWERLA